jgi:Trk-type K+ transport system membrane component
MAPYTKEEVWKFFKTYIPDVFIKRRFNFITIHYLYLIGWTILGSVMLYAIGGLHYIDSLVFASGAATQSGLNTVDVDLLHSGQQFVLYIMAMFCNPIVVHSFVVFIRLYWFEKRFKDIVLSARLMRKTKSKSRNNTMNKDDPELGKLERSVRGRDIQILRDTGHVLEQQTDDEKGKLQTNAESVTSSDQTKRHSGESSDEAVQDVPAQPANGGLYLTKTPDGVRPHVSSNHHIDFLENQRNPKDKSTLRIPSPREFDRGGKPEDVGDDGENDGIALSTNNSPVEHRRRINFDLGSRAEETNTEVSHITIDEPNIFRSREKTSTFPRMKQRQPTDRLLEPPDREANPTRSGTFSSFRRSNTQNTLGDAPYLDFQPTVGRNSFFVDLTEEEREKLGGIEYRALKTLALVLIVYFFAWHIIGVVCLTPWILQTPTYGKVVTAQAQGRVWWGIFTAGSAFNDLGFTLTNDSMIEFQYAIFPILLMTFLIVIGNTGFPCMLRLSIWVTSKLVPVGSGLWEELRFLLDHPRRCFTLLFPSGATWWLFVILIILNGLDLIFFVVLDLNDPIITALSPGIRFIDGLFQASSTRTAGFAVVNLAQLHPAIQVSYLIMMYISAFPIAISMRRTNVYEEKSLGIYGTKSDEEEDENEPSYVGAHVRKQLSFDLWYIFLGMFVIAIVEGTRLQNTNENAFTLFAVLFEIVSAYGTVGLSLGYPTINASFCAEFHVLSKLVIVAMQIRGRHRGLPYELDRAILLPSESLHEKEMKEGQKILARRRSSIPMSDTSAVQGTNPNGNFRPETGLSSGWNLGNIGGKEGSKERRTSNARRASNNAFSHEPFTHRSHVRQGLGTAMAKLATSPELVEPNEKAE